MYRLIKKNGQYGVQNDEIRVAGITANTIEAYALVYMLNEYQVSPCQIYDVIEDFWGLI